MHLDDVRVLFEPRDVWIGVYWDRRWRGGVPLLYVYICIVPVFPLRLIVRLSQEATE